MAAADGFAPSYPDPKSGVLLLDDAAKSGVPGRNRTCGLLLRREALFLLSYGDKVEPPRGLAPRCRPYRGRASLSMLQRQKKVVVRYTGDAPASPRWQRGVLLMDEYRKRNWSGGKDLHPRELGVGQPCYCYITTGSNWPLESELRRPLGFFRPAHISLCHPAKKRCVRRELHPRCLPLGNGFTGRCDTSDSRLTRN